jgi:hypothetical protein
MDQIDDYEEDYEIPLLIEIVSKTKEARTIVKKEESVWKKIITYFYTFFNLYPKKDDTFAYI